MVSSQHLDHYTLHHFTRTDVPFVESRLLSLEGGLAVGVPLELKGLALAHSRHGSLPWSRLVQPSIEPAERGFPAHPYLVAALEVQNITVIHL